MRDHAESDSVNTTKMDEVFQQQIKSININEASLEAIQSNLMTASSSNSEEHKTTHALLIQCQSQLQHILRKHITIGSLTHSGRSPSTRPNASDHIATKNSIF